MEKEETGGKILICESYPAMQQVFDVMLGREYGLVFVGDPGEIMPTLRSHQVRLLIWDIDHATGSLDAIFEAVSRDEPLDYRERTRSGDVLETLKAVRKNYPELNVLLISGHLEYDFQVAAVRECGLVGFLTKPWGSSVDVVERIQVLLGDKDGSVRKWTLRTPIDPALSSPLATGERYGNS